MRYRPLGATGIAVSTISLALNDQPGQRTSDWTALTFAALENGINSFEIAGRDPALLDGVAEALKSVSRRLVFVGLRLGNTADGRRDFSASTISHFTRAAVARSGLEYLDYVLLDDPTSEEFTPAALNALKDLKREGVANMLGVGGKDEAIDAYILTEAFDLLCTPYNMQSGWRERRRMKQAQERDMAVIGYDYFPDSIGSRGKIEAITPMAKAGGWLRKAPPPSAAAPDPYAFLDETTNWAPEEICLAYALTEPALATVQISGDNPDRLAKLAETPDRDLPSGLGSRVEMARFGTASTQVASKA